MKRSFRSSLALLLCLCMLFSVGIGPISAAAANDDAAVSEAVTIDEYLSTTRSSDKRSDISFNAVLSQIVNFLSNFFLNDVLMGFLASCVPQGQNTVSVASIDNVDLSTLPNFMSGNGAFIDNPVPGASWSLGYDEQSIIPDDFGTKFYSRASYVPYWLSNEVYTDDDGNKEDLRVRTIILDDDSGRGKVAFCVLDCIGLANLDVRRIRAALADFAAENNIVSINVSGTHTHSGLDTQGAWQDPLGTAGNNILAATVDSPDQKYGIDPAFLQKIIDATTLSVKNAFADLKKGTLSYAVTDIADYTHDRTYPYACDTNLYRLLFTPYADAATPTIIATFGCHPESSSYDFLTTEDGLKTDSKISGDFVYYMEKLVNKAGYNFIYVQGNVGTNTSGRSLSNDGLEGLTAHDGAIRLGYELAYLTLGITLDEAGCAALNEATGDLLGIATYGGNEGYTVWYAGHTAAEAVEVKPVLNIAQAQYLAEVENNVALTLSKSAIASLELYYDESNGKYYTVTEIGYIEIGDALKVFMDPGEIYSEILTGGEALNGFEYPSLRELFGENVIVCDLMNDAAGYISPDNKYVIRGYQYNPETDSLEDDSWCFLVSLGKNTASTMVSQYIALVGSARP